MRLQLIFIGVLIIGAIRFSYGQNTKELPPAEIDFLFSYYKQDGDSSAVTGGAGTEKLEDIASIITVNVPLKYNKKLNFEGGISYYTSASSDNIDPKTISSASHYNFVEDIKISLEVEDTSRRITTTNGLRGTIQNNFVSYGLWSSVSKTSIDRNRTFLLSGAFNVDRWAPYYELKKLYPREIRFSTDPLKNDTRYSLDFSFSLSQVINQRLLAMISSGVIYQWGLISTPFHRVYFSGEERADLERLPESRLRFPVSGRLNYYLSDLLIIRSFYRFYADDFGITAHTISLELPIKFSSFFSAYPYYRYHHQNASKYFAPHKMHLADSKFHTSDYDLSAFDSHMLGAGLRISPPFGINLFSKKKISAWEWKSLELRYGNYWRSNGLNAHIFSINFAIIH